MCLQGCISHCQRYCVCLCLHKNAVMNKILQRETPVLALELPLKIHLLHALVTTLQLLLYLISSNYLALNIESNELFIYVQLKAMHLACHTFRTVSISKQGKTHVFCISSKAAAPIVYHIQYCKHRHQDKISKGAENQN